MSDMIECPVPDCTYEGVEGSVKGHWGGKTDEAHSGSFYAALEEREKATESAEGGADGNPAMSGPQAEEDTQQSQTDTQEGQTDMRELPCGHEQHDVSDIEQPVNIVCETCYTRYGFDPDE
jgi:hypothetical protein